MQPLRLFCAKKYAPYFLLLINVFTFQLDSFSETPKFTSFKFEVAHNSALFENINCTIFDDSLIIGIIPYNTNLNSLKASFTSEDNDSILANGIIQQSEISANNFVSPVTYTLWYGGVSAKTYIVKLVYTGLPVVYLNTENGDPIISKDDYLNGTIKIFPNQNISVSVFSATTQVKGRGNSTWSMPKKPYKIKLNSKASLLGMPSDKEWVLLANYSDKTLMRNYLAFECSNRFSMAYTPRSQFVELIINGEYVGNYSLCEQIKVSSSRVNIKELKITDLTTPSITGGYLLEVDERLDEDYWFRTNTGVPICFNSPDSVDSLQFNYLKNFIQQTEDTLYGANFADTTSGYANFIKTQTFIDWYLINELFKNNDAVFFSSVYMYKDRGSKLCMGPVWDFDIAAGNINYNDNDNPKGWWIKNARWISRLFSDPAFAEKVKVRWNAVKTSKIETLMAFADSVANGLESSQKENFRVWPILNTLVWPNPAIRGSYANEVQYLKDWLSTRIDWMDSMFNLTSLKAFNLSLPANNSTIAIQNTNYSSKIFVWGNSGSQTGVTFKFKLDRENGNFTSPIAVFTADNNGEDYKVTLLSSQIDDILSRLNVKTGDSINLKWTVYSYLANDSLKASQTYVVTFIRNSYSGAFDLISPLNYNNTTIDLKSNPSYLFTWNKSKNWGLNYKCVFYSANQSIDAPPVSLWSDHAGTDTSLNVSLMTLQHMLFEAGYFDKGANTVALTWTVYAFSSADDSLVANQTRNISFKFKQTEFSLSEPNNLSTFSFVSGSEEPIVFKWTKSLFSSNYQCSLDINGQLLTVPSDNSGMDTTLTLDASFFENILVNTSLSNNYLKEGIAKWSVFATNVDMDSLPSNQNNELNIAIKYPLQAFSLSYPANNFTSTIKNKSNDSILFSWNKSAFFDTYRFVLTGDNMTVPLYSYVTNQDTSFQLSVSFIDELLALNNVKKGNSLSLNWSVYVYQGSTDSLQSKEINRVTFTRTRDLKNFELLQPQNNEKFEWKEQDVKSIPFSWQSSLNNALYKVYFDFPFGTFTAPIMSLNAGNSGQDTAIVLDNKSLELMLADSGVTFTDSLVLKWKVTAYTDDDTLDVGNSFLFHLKKANSSSISKTYKLNNHLLVYPNPSKDLVNIELTSIEPTFKVSITDISGKVYNTYELLSNTRQKIDLSGFQNGLYFIQFNDGNKVYSQKLIIGSSN